MVQIHCNMEHHHILEKIQIVKKNVMHILSEITVIEYQVHQLTLKHRSPPRKKTCASYHRNPKERKETNSASTSKQQQRAASKLYHDTKAIQRQKGWFQRSRESMAREKSAYADQSTAFIRVGQETIYCIVRYQFSNRRRRSQPITRLGFWGRVCAQGKGAYKGNGVAMVLSVETSHRQW